MNQFKSRTAKAFSGLLGLATAVTMFAGVAVAPAQASALTSAQISSIVSLLQSFGADATTIANVQASLNGQPTSGSGSSSSSSTGGSCSYVFTQTLKQGSTGTEVMNLQKALNMWGFTVSASGAGSPGNESSYFGPATAKAVSKFQMQYAAQVLTPLGLTAGTGTVGAATRAELNSLCMSGSTSSGSTSSGTGSVPASVNTTLTVSAAASQPANSLAPQSAARVPFTKVVITNNGSVDAQVTGVTVERDGLAQDAAFSGIVLLDENGMQMDIAHTLNSNHQSVIGGTFTVPAHGSRTLTVAGNMNSSLGTYAGEVAELSVVGVTSNATVSGSFPIMGAQQTINATLTLGSVSMGTSAFDPGTNQTKQIGTTGYKFSGFRLTAGSAEPIKIWSIRWNQTGSVGAGDLSNVQTYVNGTAYPATVDSTGKYYVTSFPGGISLDKGVGADVYVQADITGTGASGRTAKFDIYKSTDIAITGSTYGYGITPPAGSNTVSVNSCASSCGNFTNGTPYFQGYIATISAGSATYIQKSSNVPAQNVSVGVADQPLGGYDTSFLGEPVSVQNHTITLNVAGAGLVSDLITGVKIVDQNGSVVAGPVDATGATTSQTVAFTDTITYPVGTATYKIVGKLPSDYANGATIFAQTTPSSWTNVTGQTSGNTITLSTGQFSMNTMTVRAGNLSVTTATTPAAQNIVAGTTGVTFANIQLDASASGEDVRVNSLPVVVGPTGGSNASQLSSCQLWNGSTALNNGSNIVNPSLGTANTNQAVTFTFDQSLIVPKGTVVTLALKCNVSGSATQTQAWTLNAATTTAVAATGVTSSVAISATATGAGQAMTVQTSQMTIATDPSSPSYTIAAGGTTGVTLGVAKFHATNDSVNLQKVGLKIETGAASNDLAQVTLWNGTTQIGTAVFTGGTATSTLSTPLNLPKDADTLVTIKGDLASVGISQPGTEGDVVKVDVINAQGVGVGSGTTVNAGAGTTVAGVALFRTYPTIAQDTLPSNAPSDGRLLHFKVTASNAGPVGLGSLKFTISTSTGVTVTGINLYAYTDSGYSVAANTGNSGGAVAASSVGGNGTGFAVAPNGASPIEIPVGTTWYFELRGTVAGTVTGSSVVTTLLGDSAAPSPVMQAIAGLGSSNFIWSPNATTTTVSTTNDWTNSAGVVGLPSSGLIQSRTQ